MAALAERVHAAAARGDDILNAEFAESLDAVDELSPLRGEFLFPPTAAGSRYRAHSPQCLYFCGNSLGLQPKGVRVVLDEELRKWHLHGVEGHFVGDRPWVTVDETVPESLARVVGALPREVVAMNSLTANIHFLMISFYTPTPTRYKILLESKSFPSDYYALESQVRLHGFDPKDALIEVAPRDGELCLRQEDIDAAIAAAGPQLALVMFSGVQYFTGQAFDIPRITRAAHDVGAVAGFDLAHAVGNVVLQLHDWDVDFAAWCSYKYLNSGPGGIGGAFVHEKHDGSARPRLQGWWGARKTDRFDMGHDFHSSPGAFGFQLSNPPVLTLAALYASLQVFDRTSMDVMRAKSLALTGYLELLIRRHCGDDVTIITPTDPSQRGCQLSLRFTAGCAAIAELLERESVVVDIRKPDVMRVSPAPLYNSFSDVADFVRVLRDVLAEVRTK